MPLTPRLLVTVIIVIIAMLLSFIAAATSPAVRLAQMTATASSATFDPQLPSPPLHTPLLSQLSTLSPVPLPFLERLDSLLSGEFPLSNLLSLRWWIEWGLLTWSQDPGHLALEALCLAIILYLWLRKPYDPRDEEKLSKEEEEELIRSWRPEPLAAPLPATTALRHTPVIQAYSHQHLTIGGRSFLSFASFNFLGLSSLPSIKAACRQTIEKYGVGSCGPRGFYGSFDVHLEVERRLAEFLHGDACILYSDGIATLASVIPAFSKRGDLIVCDETVNFGIQQGIRLSRSNVLYYRHNDMQDLERILSQVQEKELRHPSKLNRRFIVAEGIAQHSGDISPLPHIIRLKQRYKYRLILDDTLAIGVLGATGRGSLEHWAVGVEQCDLYCASMDGALATVGGFCIGAQQIVDHQRLSGAGYCLPEVDSRVLTEDGFLFLSEIKAQIAQRRRQGRAPLLYGCYEKATQSLVYKPGRLVETPPPARWVDFTQAATRPLWDATSTDYGGTVGVRRRQANYLTLRTTPEHDMYVQIGTRLGCRVRTGSDGVTAVPADKMPAEEMAPGFACSCVEDGQDCPHGYPCYRFFTSPASGVSSTDVMSIHDTEEEQPDSPVVRLGLRSDDQLNAFLELYGYWLGDGSLQYDGATSARLIFAPKKERDGPYILGLIRRLPLQATDWSDDGVSASGCSVFRIKALRWTRFFDEEYGAKYARSRERRAGGADSCFGAPSSSPARVRGEGGADCSAAGGAGPAGSHPFPLPQLSQGLVAGLQPRSAVASEPPALAVPALGRAAADLRLLPAEPPALRGRSGQPAACGCDVDLTEQSDGSASSDDESDSDKENAALVPPNIKSAKWFWYWVRKRLSRAQMQRVIEGLRQADGVSARTKAQEARGSEFSGLQRICTSSVAFRDELIQACLHAGYTAHFTINTRSGTVRGYNAVPTDYRIYSQEEMEQLLFVEPGRVFQPVQARHDNWWIHYSLLSSWLAADEVRYDGKALRLRERRKQCQGFVAEHSDGRVVSAKSQGGMGKLIGVTQTTVSRFFKQGVKRTKAGWVLYTAADYEQRLAAGEEQGGALPAGGGPATASAMADAYSPRDGAVWCVDVDHDDHLIFAQRAHRNGKGVVTKAGLPIIIGNCFSASSPPYTGTAAIMALDHIDAHAELCRSLREKAASMRRLLSSVPQLQVVGKAADADSPVIHLVLRDGSGVREEDETVMLRIANKLYSDDSIVVVVPEYIPGERANPPVSLMIAVTVEHEERDMERLLKALKKAAQDIVGRRQQH